MVDSGLLVERNAVHFNACMNVYAKSARWEMAVALLDQVGASEANDCMHSLSTWVESP